MTIETETNPAQPATPALTGKRANWTIAHKIGENQITWSVKGATEGEPLLLDLSKVSLENRNRAMLHGFVQRVSDAAAMARDSKTGASATPQEKFEAMRRLVAHYQSGSVEWSPLRATEGVGRPRVDKDKELLVRALGVHAPQKSAETVGKFVQGLKKEQVTALLLSSELKVSVEVAREQLREEEMKAAEGVDAGELLKGL